MCYRVSPGLCSLLVLDVHCPLQCETIFFVDFTERLVVFAECVHAKPGCLIVMNEESVHGIVRINRQRDLTSDVMIIRSVPELSIVSGRKGTPDIVAHG